MTVTGSPSPPYAGPDEAVVQNAPASTMPINDVLQPLPPEAVGEVIPAEPPSGDNVITAMCCPPAVEFYGAVVRGNLRYFGYDAANNRTLPNDDAHVYWYVGPLKNRVDIEYGSLSEPASRTELDGSVWFSVGVGETTRFAAEFLGSGCFDNVTFESQNPDIAVPVETRGKSTLMEMAVRGVGVGETTIFARCDGQLVGWVHIWCAEVVTIKVGIGSVIAPGTTSYPCDIALLETYLSNTFGQARILIDLIDLGEIHMPDLAVANPKNPISELKASQVVIQEAANAAGARYTIMFYTPSDPAFIPTMEAGGEVGGEVGKAKIAYVYSQADAEEGYQAVAHELGHLLNLSHPDSDLDSDEFPDAHWEAMTDPAHPNVVIGREDYLMGYGAGMAAQLSFSPMQINIIGYMQWKKLFRR